jgi:hypothetical protein
LLSTTEVQFNCKANLARIVPLSYYSGAMLAGSQLHQQGMLQDWFELEAGSPMKRVAAKVCSCCGAHDPGLALSLQVCNWLRLSHDAQRSL